MTMWMKVVIFLLTISSIGCAQELITAKIGETVKLNYGSNVYFWTRRRTSKEDFEFIEYCGPEKDSRCKFVNAQDKPVLPESKAHVEKDGTLVIESIKPTDAGFYAVLKKHGWRHENGMRLGKTAKEYILEVKS
ncbi:unnamed protein product [Cylicocyclus nassatus]|uniref:Uncharacterized protein n=1 Tax=Cylicocyclus nassatus TaxID=53992 RepID=A0AA36M8A9_CYLNA|nr:unnamed protein product [Cylicocyclus nassatus]